MILRCAENVQGMQRRQRLWPRSRRRSTNSARPTAAVQDHKRTIFQKISLFQPGMGLLTQVNMAVLLAYGGYLVVHGELRLGEGLFVFANLLARVRQPGRADHEHHQQHPGQPDRRAAGVRSARRAGRSGQPGRRRYARAQRRGSVRFERVSFGYPAERRC